MLYFRDLPVVCLAVSSPLTLDVFLSVDVVRASKKFFFWFTAGRVSVVQQKTFFMLLQLDASAWKNFLCFTADRVSLEKKASFLYILPDVSRWNNVSLLGVSFLFFFNAQRVSGDQSEKIVIRCNTWPERTMPTIGKPRMRIKFPATTKKFATASQRSVDLRLMCLTKASGDSWNVCVDPERPWTEEPCTSTAAHFE